MPDAQTFNWLILLLRGLNCTATCPTTDRPYGPSYLLLNVLFCICLQTSYGRRGLSVRKALFHPRLTQLSACFKEGRFIDDSIHRPLPIESTVHSSLPDIWVSRGCRPNAPSSPTKLHLLNSNFAKQLVAAVGFASRVTRFLPNIGCLSFCFCWLFSVQEVFNEFAA